MNTGMRDYPLSLKAGAIQRLQAVGDYFLVVKAASGVELNFDDTGWITRWESDGMGVNAYARVQVRSAADQDVIVALGFTGGAVTPTSGRAQLSGSVNVTVNSPTQRPTPADVSIPAGTTQMVLPVDATRISAIVQLDEIAPGHVRVGDSSVSGLRGLKTQPDDAVECDGIAAVYVYNPNAVAVTIHLQTEIKP